jgi:hypothetical protein
MTHKMQRLRVAALVLALTTLAASHVTGQTGKLEDDLQRAQEILAQLSTGELEDGARMSVEEELALIEAYEYVVRVKLTARKYTAGSGYFPVTVSKAGLLEPPLVGRIEMPRGTARRAKSKLSAAYASVAIRAVAGASRVATKVAISVWVTVDGKAWLVATDDTRLVGKPLPSTGDAQGVETLSAPAVPGTDSAPAIGEATAAWRGGVLELAHQGPVRQVMYSPDGTTIATSSADWTARLWDPETGARRATLQHEKPVLCMAFSADGRFIATGSDDGTAKIWEVDGGRLVHTLPHGGWVRFVAYSPDGQFLAASSDNASVHLWDARAGALLHRLPHAGIAYGLDFQPGGNYSAPWPNLGRSVIVRA